MTGPDRAAEVVERRYTVSGMTCGHCVASVREEVEDLAGVVDTVVDLDSGSLVVRSYGVSDHAVFGAVTEAGYVAVRV